MRSRFHWIGKEESTSVIGQLSGKSTMLKLATRIYEPTNGYVQVNGRASALLELGAGFHQELTGRENIYLNAAFYGLTEAQINSVIDDIVELLPDKLLDKRMDFIPAMITQTQK